VACGGGPVGTSTGWGGPRWGDLLGASKRSVRDEYAAGQVPLQRHGDADGRAWAALWGERWLERLHGDVAEDPDAYGLRDRAGVMGRELVLAVAVLRDRGRVPGETPLVAQLADRVAGAGTGVVDTAGRRAAVRAGERLFPRPDDALFCLVYREFFADLVVEFLRAVIAEELNAAVAADPVQLDPAGEIADRMAARLVALLPDPCAEVLPGRSVLEAAIERVPEMVDAALGLRGRA
jgi:hypothetical protein